MARFVVKRSISDNPAEDEVLYKSRTGWEVEGIEEKGGKTFIYLFEHEGEENAN